MNLCKSDQTHQSKGGNICQWSKKKAVLQSEASGLINQKERDAHSFLELVLKLSLPVACVEAQPRLNFIKNSPKSCLQCK